MSNENKKTPETTVKAELATATCSQLVMPCGMATIHISEHEGPYRRVFRTKRDGIEMAYFYKGRKRVWECNATFGRLHFYEVSANTKAWQEGRPGANTTKGD